MTNKRPDVVFYVSDFFPFSDGSTVFCGKVKEDIGRISPGKYFLKVDENIVQELNIMSEMLPKKLGLHLERSINTMDRICLSKDMIGRYEIKITNI